MYIAPTRPAITSMIASDKPADDVEALKLVPAGMLRPLPDLRDAMSLVLTHGAAAVGDVTAGRVRRAPALACRCPRRTDAMVSPTWTQREGVP